MRSRDMTVDLDCFFASVEQQLEPTLRGRPVGVVPVVTDSTCCIATSKEAKKFGVKTGTGVREARQLCPEIALVESRPEVYLEFHHRFITALEVWVPVEEVMSIDEVRCRLPDGVGTRDEAEAFVRRLKGTLHAHLGEVVTYSVGIGPNHFLSKLASDMGKPNGCFIIEKHELPDCLHGLKLRDFCGIGKKMEQHLKDHGIATVAQFAAASRETLHAVWGGITGHHMWHWLRGEAAGEPPRKHRTIGHSHVLPIELRNERGVHAVCHRLVQKAAMRLRKLGYFASSLHMFVEFTDGHTWSREVRFTETQDTFVFLDALEKLWQQHPRRAGIPPLKTGINFAPIIPAHRVTPDFLLHDPRHEKLCHLMDGLNRQFGQNTVTFGGALGALDYTPMRIAFTRIPDRETEG